MTAVRYGIRIANLRAAWLIKTTIYCVLAFWAGLFVFKTVMLLEPVGHYAKWISIEVPDHCEGTDPEIVVSRILKRPFRAHWYIQAENDRDPNRPPECSNDEFTAYAERPMITVQVPLSNYLGRQCFIHPGRWHLEVRRTIINPWRWPREAPLQRSNSFTVLPKTDPRCKT